MGYFAKQCRSFNVCCNNVTRNEEINNFCKQLAANGMEVIEVQQSTGGNDSFVRTLVTVWYLEHFTDAESKD